MTTKVKIARTVAALIGSAVLLVPLKGENDLPPVAMATVKTATVPLPVIRLAEVPLPEIKLPEITTVTFVSDLSALSNLSDKSDTLAIATVSLAKVAVTTAADMTAVKELRETKARLFRDQRNLIYDSSAVPGNVDFAAWLDLYKNHTPYTAAYIPLQDGVRMVAELRHPVDEKVLADNLTFYKSKGYNAILITFDGFEEPYHLTALADKVTAAGFKVWYAFGGVEDLKLSVFVHPAKLRRLIGAIAPRAEGTLLNWRRTSQHLLLPDQPFTDFFIKEGRAANPKLQLVGESYFGHNGENEKNFTVATSVPANSSGVLLCNVGFHGINAKGALNSLFGHLKKYPRLVLIVGDRPYYATRSKNALDFSGNFAVKCRLEERFLAAGAAGTVTLHGDGSNGLYNRNHTDNLGATSR